MRLDKNDRPRVRSRIGFHMFRHMCASLLFEHGMNIVKVSRWLGHADPAFTLRTYVHTLDDGLGDVAFLDTAFAPASRHRGDPEAEKLADRDLVGVHGGTAETILRAS